MKVFMVLFFELLMVFEYDTRAVSPFNALMKPRSKDRAPLMVRLLVMLRT